MLAYQTVCYYRLKRVGSAIGKSHTTGQVYIFHIQLLYYDNIALLRYNRWKASDNIRQLIDTRVIQVRKYVYKPYRHWHAFKHDR